MNTTQTESRALPDAAQITEADVLAFLKQKKAELQPEFPTLYDFGVSLDSDGYAVIGGYMKGTHDRVIGLKEGFDAALAHLRSKNFTTAARAAEKREQAAKLLAEAEALAPSRAVAPTPTA